MSKRSKDDELSRSYAIHMVRRAHRYEGRALIPEPTDPDRVRKARHEPASEEAGGGEDEGGFLDGLGEF
jgi:hypothetical protein